MVGRTATGKEAGVVDVVAEVGEEVGEDFGEAGTGREVDSVVGMEVAGEATEVVVVEAVDIAMEVLAEVTTSREEETGGIEEGEEDTKEIGTSQPPMARPGTNFHSAIHMFTQKTADFYR